MPRRSPSSALICGGGILLFRFRSRSGSSRHPARTPCWPAGIRSSTIPGRVRSAARRRRPTSGVVVSHEYKFEDFSVIQTTAPATGSKAGGTAQPISFKATTPVDGTSDQLVSLSNAIPELTVRLEGSSATDAFAFRNCRRTSTAPTASKTPSIPLSFACESSTFSSQTQAGKANPASSTARRPGGGGPACKRR
jgi:hypothetical protein